MHGKIWETWEFSLVRREPVSHVLHLIFIFAGCQVDSQVSVVVEPAPGVRFVSGRTQDGVSSRILFSFLSNHGEGNNAFGTSQIF